MSRFKKSYGFRSKRFTAETTNFLPVKSAAIANGYFSRVLQNLFQRNKPRHIASRPFFSSASLHSCLTDRTPCQPVPMYPCSVDHRQYEVESTDRITCIGCKTSAVPLSDFAVISENPCICSTTIVPSHHIPSNRTTHHYHGSLECPGSARLTKKYLSDTSFSLLSKKAPLPSSRPCLLISAEPQWQCFEIPRIPCPNHVFHNCSLPSKISLQHSIPFCELSLFFYCHQLSEYVLSSSPCRRTENTVRKGVRS